MPPRHGKPTKPSVLRAWLRGRANRFADGILLIPKQVIDRIANGENALRALREWRGKTQLDIAHKTKIGRVTFPTWKADGEREQLQL